MIVEGVAIPDRTFGGYQVLDDLTTAAAGDLRDISEYQLTANQPRVLDDSANAPSLASELEGEALVEQVELVYAASAMQGCGMFGGEMPAEAPWLIAQPVWRFMARFEDGRIFEIQIQALAEAYLE